MTLRQEKLCAARIHCWACRNDERQRKLVGLPEICQEGFTADNLPEVPEQHKQPAFDVPDGAYEICKRCKRAQCDAGKRTDCANNVFVQISGPCPDNKW